MKKREKTGIRRLEQFQFYDFTGIEKHLKKMAAQGWLLTDRGNTFWHYEAIPPQDLNFAVTYLPDVSDFDPQPTDGQLLYYELCESAGWVRVASWNKMQIFCTSNPNPVPLETDPAIRLETVAKSMNRTFIPNMLAFLFLCGVQIWSFLQRVEINPAEALSSPITLLIPVLFFLLAGQHILEALPYCLWLHRSRKSVAHGGDLLPSRSGWRYLSWGILVLSLLCLVLMFTSGEVPWGFTIATMFIIAGPVILVTWIALSIKEDLKKQKTPRRKNQVITISVAVIGTVFAMGLILYLTLMSVITFGGFSGSEETVDITLSDSHTMTWDIYRDELPLYVQDLPGLENLEYEYYSCENRRHGTILASFSEVRQDAPPHPDADVPQLAYEITETRFRAIHELCLDHYLHPDQPWNNDSVWTVQDADKYGWEQVWQLYTDGAPRDRWLFADSTNGTFRIIEMVFYWDPTPQQVQAAARKLAEGEKLAGE